MVVGGMAQNNSNENMTAPELDKFKLKNSQLFSILNFSLSYGHVAIPISLFFHFKRAIINIINMCLIRCYCRLARREPMRGPGIVILGGPYPVTEKRLCGPAGFPIAPRGPRVN
jgi:hypothetical protein